ncbi:MAG: hypothetical protein ACOYBS_11215 [Flavobacterium sp.]
MKHFIIIILLLSFSTEYSYSQNKQKKVTKRTVAKATTEGNRYSNSEINLKDWLEGRKFQCSSNGLIIEYGYISSLNTYGFTFTNSYNNEFYFINCSTESNTAETIGIFSNCLNPENGSGIGVAKVYRNLNKIVVGDLSGQFTYNLIEN